jgi:hypothetical protein
MREAGLVGVAVTFSSLSHPPLIHPECQPSVARSGIGRPREGWRFPDPVAHIGTIYSDGWKHYDGAGSGFAPEPRQFRLKWCRAWKRGWMPSPVIRSLITRGGRQSIAKARYRRGQEQTFKAAGADGARRTGNRACRQRAEPGSRHDRSRFRERSPAYWYYCPSYGTYYPNVTSCPEAWVPIPAS